ncbi:DUF1643 domain-containing protein [Clostridium butyricum]
MSCKYPEYIDVNKIKCDTKKLYNNIYQRNYLNIPLKDDNNGDINIILMNPSIANSTISDRTVNNIITYFENSKFSSVTILNLIPIYQTQSENLYDLIIKIVNDKSSDLMRKVLDENLDKIKLNINKSSDVVLAWGDCPANFNSVLYFNTIYKVLSYLDISKNIYCFDFEKSSVLTKNGNPYHPSRKGNIVGLKQLSLNPVLMTLFTT